jgi:ABC-type sugar transport system permease subunit
MVIAYFLYQKNSWKRSFPNVLLSPIYVTPAVSTAVVFRIIFDRPNYSIAKPLDRIDWN